MRYHLLMYCAVLFLLFQQVTCQAQIDLERIKVTKEISMKVPTSFTPMTQSELNNKYVSYRQPIAMFTSNTRDADLGINRNSTPWEGNDLDILKAFYKANIQNLFTEVDFITEEIRETADRKFVVFEFMSKVSGENNTYGGLSSPVSKYTNIVYTLYNDQVLLFNFTCDASNRIHWQEAAREIMSSIRIK